MKYDGSPEPTTGSRGASASGGASYNGKRRYVESCTMQQNETEDQVVMDEIILKALNDLKSDMGFVKKYMAAQEQAKHTEVQNKLNILNLRLRTRVGSAKRIMSMFSKAPHEPNSPELQASPHRSLNRLCVVQSQLSTHLILKVKWHS